MGRGARAIGHDQSCSCNGMRSGRAERSRGLKMQDFCTKIHGVYVGIDFLLLNPLLLANSCCRIHGVMNPSFRPESYSPAGFLKFTVFVSVTTLTKPAFFPVL